MIGITRRRGVCYSRVGKFTLEEFSLVRNAARLVLLIRTHRHPMDFPERSKRSKRSLANRILFQIFRISKRFAR